MSHNYSKFIGSFVFLAIVVSGGCQSDSGCPQVKNRTYDLSEDEKMKIPFTGNDTMTFLNNAKVVKLTAQGKQGGFLTKVIRGSVPIGCTEPINSYEKVSVNFVSNDTLLKEINFSLNRAQQPSYNSTGVWTVTSQYPVSFTANFATMMSDTFYKDTVLVGGIQYNCIKIAADTGDISNMLYYNHNFGILKMNLPQGQIWLRQ